MVGMFTSLPRVVSLNTVFMDNLQATGMIEKTILISIPWVPCYSFWMQHIKSPW